MRGRQSACCFTGHRPAKLPWGYREEDLRCLDLKRRMADAVEAGLCRRLPPFPVRHGHGLRPVFL